MSDTIDVIALLRRAALEVTGRELGALAMDSDLADAGIDSVGLVEMAGWIEEHLGLRFPDEKIAKLATVTDVASLVELARRTGEAR